VKVTEKDGVLSWRDDCHGLAAWFKGVLAVRWVRPGRAPQPRASPSRLTQPYVYKILSEEHSRRWTSKTDLSISPLAHR